MNLAISRQVPVNLFAISDENTTGFLIFDPKIARRSQVQRTEPEHRSGASPNFLVLLKPGGYAYGSGVACLNSIQQIFERRLGCCRSSQGRYAPAHQHCQGDWRALSAHFVPLGWLSGSESNRVPQAPAA